MENSLRMKPVSERTSRSAKQCYRQFDPACEHLLKLDRKTLKLQLRKKKAALKKSRGELVQLQKTAKDLEAPRTRWTQMRKEAAIQVKGIQNALKSLQKVLQNAEKQIAAANAELESLRQVPERIVALSDRIKEDEEAAALLQMEETRRATGRDRLSELPSSLLAHTGAFMEYRREIAEVAVISKEFYSACEEHKKCFKKNPFVGLRVQGAGDEDCNGMYERKEVSGPAPQGFWGSATYWKKFALPPYWYAGPSGRYMRSYANKTYLCVVFCISRVSLFSFFIPGSISRRKRNI